MKARENWRTRMYGAALVGLLLVAGCNKADPKFPPGNSVDAGGGATVTKDYPVGSIDNLSANLAGRAQTWLGTADDFQIEVTRGNYPIGTLLRPNSTIPVEYDACLPNAAPPQVGTPSLFPNYSMSRETATAFGLDDAVLKGVARANANLSRTNSIKLGFADSSISTLSDQDIKRITTVPACAELLAQGPVWLVRGYVVAKRTFKFDKAQANDGNLSVTKVAAFDVKVADGNSAVELSDAAPVGFLQIVSALAPKSVQPAGAPAVDFAAVKPTAPVQKTGHIYVQRDAGDDSGIDGEVVSALRTANLLVIPKVEAIPTNKMPRTAQVRYFNADDIGLASQALAELRKSYPEAKLVRVPLPSPKGQLEVWLPKAGATRVDPLAIRRSEAAATVLLKTH